MKTPSRARVNAIKYHLRPSLAIFASSSEYLRSFTRPAAANCTRISHAALTNSANGCAATGASTRFLKSVSVFRAHHVVQDRINSGTEVVKATGERVQPLAHVVEHRVLVHV